MVRNRKKKALYEVIGKTWPKPRYDKLLHQEETSGDVPVTGKSLTSMSRLTKWPRKPRFVHLNVDRIELSIPYQLAIALLLGLILLVLVVFRLGQGLGAKRQAASLAEMQTTQAAPDVVADTMPQAAPAEIEAPAPASAEGTVPADLTGNNRIVIQTYQVRAHLEPVKQYFARFGIETEIRRIDNWYYLVTEDRYENPEKPGTDGYLAKQKIIQLGAEYKAPAGYETFGSSPFHDAYGMRFDE
jgi:hypothetical protein